VADLLDNQLAGLALRDFVYKDRCARPSKPSIPQSPSLPFSQPILLYSRLLTSFTSHKMVALRSLLAGIAIIAAPLVSAIEPADVALGLGRMAAQAEALQRPASEITIINAPLIVVGQGPYPASPPTSAVCSSSALTSYTDDHRRTQQHCLDCFDPDFTAGRVDPHRCWSRR